MNVDFGPWTRAYSVQTPTMLWCEKCHEWGNEWGRPDWVSENQTHLQRSCRKCFQLRFWSLRDELSLRFVLGNLGLLEVDECDLDYIAIGDLPSPLADGRKEAALRDARAAHSASERLAAIRTLITLLDESTTK